MENGRLFAGVLGLGILQFDFFVGDIFRHSRADCSRLELVLLDVLIAQR